MTDRPLPLAGVKVLEFCQTIMGPTAGMVLADLGADVIKIEPAPAGDKTRKLSGFAAGFFAGFNRNKRSVALDLKSDAGRGAAHTLVKAADVVLENYAPGTMEKLGCDYETLKALNPRLIFCSLKGFLSGPYEDRLALDEVVQFMAGMSYMTGPPGRPLRAGASIIDIMGGSYAVIGILCALKERDASGEGQFVKSALYESTAFLMTQHLAGEVVTGRETPPMPARIGAWSVYETFETKDGRHVFIGLTSDNHWRRFRDRFGLEHLTDDPDFETNESRVTVRPKLLPMVAEIAVQFDHDELLEILETIEVPFSPVAKPSDLFDDPQLNAGGRMLPVEMPNGKVAKLPRLPIEVGDHNFGLRRQPPEIGADTRDILAEAGFSADDIQALADAGAILINKD
jgi:crotonobetainyl-CoA:carnitine CoA-transferase CaiB-like acyl-CoA transferase